ncbi:MULTISPECIES: hypothetical protein [Halomonadaceae]|uniref:hypothetical protein n=1 Tax=Halomonadaceae TaxID=28256 RepID=UPI0012DAAA14|nr:hypothetical protein [Halomonas sp. Choline-3u-9]NAO97572.1 hypothetical protein [Halomonas sp. MG34]QGQ70041.1 hypothetical protein FDY98_08185 [Halomonas sp. PA16-9]
MVSEAHPRKQRAAVPGLACVGDDGSVPLGVVPTPPAGASKRSLNSLSRYHALRVQSLDSGGIPTFMCTRDLVARGKRSAPAGAARSGAGVGEMVMLKQ